MSGKADVSRCNAVSNPAISRMMTRVEAAHAARIWPEINLWTNDGQQFEREVELPGLTVHALKGVFARVMWDRRRWCRQNCQGVFAIEPIRDDGQGLDTGRRFLFSDAGDARLFRQIWC